MNEKYHQIILHVGMHKTGTTSIQNNCYRNRKTLAEHGIIYPSFSYLDQTRSNHSGPITAAVSDKPDRYGEQWRAGLGNNPKALQQAYQDQFRELLDTPKADTLILSGETISAFANDDLKKLRKQLLQHTDHLKVLVYLRNPASAVGSILQQRVRGGGDRDTDDNIIALASISRRRYQRLKKVFGDSLDVLNFHEAVSQPSGLVGSFMEFCGLPAEETLKLEFAAANPRTSMESFKLMLAINKVYPAKSGDEGRQREYNDLRPLSLLPGQPFRMENLDSAKVQREIDAETQWLSKELNLNFPETPAKTEQSELWNTPVLYAVEEAIRALENDHHRIAAADFLLEESAQITPGNPTAGTILAFIAQKIKAVETNPAPLILERLGADYFKNSALAIENYSPELALELMSLAQHLRPGGKTVNKSILKYQKRLPE
ncbi:MAG: hypothetical protein V7709_15830 [Halioglobus sp.]